MIREPGPLFHRPDQPEPIEIGRIGVMTTYDPKSDTFGHATTIIGGPFAPEQFQMDIDYAIEMVADARRRHFGSKDAEP